MRVVRLNSYVLPAYILMLVPPLVVIPLLLKYILLFLGLYIGVRLLRYNISTKRILNITNSNFIVCMLVDFIMYIIVYVLSILLPHYKWVNSIEEQVMLNPFSSLVVGLCYIGAIVVEGVISYLWIKKQLIKAGFTKLVYSKIAVITAIVAMPYIILIPKRIIEGLLFMH